MTGHDDRIDAVGPPSPAAPLATITGNENLLILLSRPGDESRLCGGLIAESCRRGRPPFVMILSDGTRSGPKAAGLEPGELANQHDRETRIAIGHLGLSHERLLMAGLYDGTIPSAGPVFDAIVRAVTLVMWARDCNVICAPWPEASTDGQAETYRIALAVAAASGVGLLAFTQSDTLGGTAWRLDIGSHLVAKRAAIAAHAACAGGDGAARAQSSSGGSEVADGLAPYEVLWRPSSDQTGGPALSPQPPRAGRGGS